jgi:hypothetical protein
MAGRILTLAGKGGRCLISAVGRADRRAARALAIRRARSREPLRRPTYTSSIRNYNGLRWTTVARGYTKSML